MFTFFYDNDFSFKNRLRVPKPAFESYDSPERVRSIWSYLQSIHLFDKPEIHINSPHDASEKDVLRVHSPYYLITVKNLTAYGGGELGKWVKITRETFSLALKSAGAVKDLLELVSGVKKDSPPQAGFSLNRPPGHHATKDNTEGLCVFNNVAIGIQSLRENHNFHDKIAIIDIDAHFGNGTSAIFYEDPSVLHYSIHESNFQASDGMSTEIGAREGVGTNINYRVPLGATNEIWLRAFHICEQILQSYKPKIIIVAVGLDGHWTDPMANLNLTSEAYREFGKWIFNLSQSLCEGRVAFVLEGGYSYLMLGPLVESLIASFISEDYKPESPIDLLFKHKMPPDTEELMKQQIESQEQTLKVLLEPYWKINL